LVASSGIIAFLSEFFYLQAAFVVVSCVVRPCASFEGWLAAFLFGVVLRYILRGYVFLGSGALPIGCELSEAEG
jgi:hypothetical protein